jgi:RNA polymerase sigma-70 factor (ECF subfamily)
MMTPSTPFQPFLPIAPYAPAALPSRPAPNMALVAELAPRMRAVTRAILGRAHPELEDAHQQATLELIRALPSFRGDCAPVYFASRIAARNALTYARRSRTANARRDHGADVDEVVASAHPQEETEQNRRMAVLRDLLTRIPSEQAETLSLRVVLGWSLPEVASATGVPLNTVRSRIRLAKNALRAAVEADPVLREQLGQSDD